MRHIREKFYSVPQDINTYGVSSNLLNKLYKKLIWSDVACNLCIYWKNLIIILTKNSKKYVHNGNNFCVVCNCKISPTYSNVWIDDRIAIDCPTENQSLAPGFYVYCVSSSQHLPKPFWLMCTHTEPRLCL